MSTNPTQVLQHFYTSGILVCIPVVHMCSQAFPPSPVLSQWQKLLGVSLWGSCASGNTEVMLWILLASV